MRRFMLLLAICQLAFSAFAQNHPVSWEFSSKQTGPLTYEVKYQAEVKAPYHIYPQGRGGGMGMPTEFLFEPNDNVEFSSELLERGVEQHDGEHLSHYAKGVTFTHTLKLRSEKKTTLAFTIKYMACTNQMCLPPSKKQFTLELGSPAQNAVALKSDDPADLSRKGTISFQYEDFVMPDVEGKEISSKDITSKSKYTFIDFWASWCSPCRSQGRELIPIYQNYKPKGFDVIAISLDTDVKVWKKAIQADGYAWVNLSDLKGFDSALSKRYHITAIPRNLLIDQKGNIVAIDIHGKELEAKLAELFKI